MTSPSYQEEPFNSCSMLVALLFGARRREGLIGFGSEEECKGKLTL